MFSKKILGLSSVIFLMSTHLVFADDKTIHCALKIDHIEALKGHIKISLYNSAASYETLDGNKAFKAFNIKAESTELLVDFGNIPAGDYWISFYHDANDNGQLDKNFMGIPKEGYGFSNNGGQFGPPSAKDAKLSLGQDAEIVIHER